MMEIQRIAAFSDGDKGGNPAGVLLCAALPEAAVMQRIAAEIGYSESVFAAPAGDLWRVRYFSPQCEVPFCGHATIALGTALAAAQGDGVFTLRINAADITVAGSQTGAALQSPPTHSAGLSPAVAEAALALFGLGPDDLDPRIPPALAHAGADHFVLALADRGRLRAMAYDLAAGQVFMRAHDLATIMLVHAETAQLFHARNPFASSGVYEDPATGAAAAALGGYLRDLGWAHGGVIDIVQGADMGMRSCLRVEITDLPGASVRVSGTTRRIS